MVLVDYHNSEDYIKALRSGFISNFHILNYFNRVPEYLYKFKSFGKWNGNQWEEDEHWKDIIEGILFFCVPDTFNKNDPNDCKFQCNKYAVIRHLEEKFNKKPESKIEELINQYIEGLQKTSRICCFTENNEASKFMWNNDNFTSNGYGLCVKYKFNEDKKIFLQRTITCLPVAYTDENMDFTDEVCLFMDLVQKYGNNMPTLDDPNVINDPKVREFVSKANAYTLIKKKQYQNENEWRIVVPQNRYKDYLTIKDKDENNENNENNENCKRDFISAMEAIYINSKCFEIPNWNNCYLDFIKNKCLAKGIDLFCYNEQSNSSYKIQ